MVDEPKQAEDLISHYKEMLRGYLETRPSGLRKKIAEGIGTNSSFVSQITNPKYPVPIPSHYVHKIMDICHLSPVDRSAFIAAYLAAHPGQAALMNNQSVADANFFKIDLSDVSDGETRDLIKQTLNNMAETLIAVSKGDRAKK